MSAVPANAQRHEVSTGTDRKIRTERPDGRLHKHADYQRVYRSGKRRSLPLMTYFVAAQLVPPQTSNNSADAVNSVPLTTSNALHGPRIGITAGRVLGNAVERNRIKRRMREAIRRNRAELTAQVDVILHPRRAVLDAEFSAIEQDVRRALHWAQGFVSR